MKKHQKKAAHESTEDECSRKVEQLTRLIIFFALLGLVISTYMTWLHYKQQGKSFCSISEKFDCDVVNKSSYAEIVGVPVAVIGVIGYLLFAIAGLGFLSGYEWSGIHKKLKARHVNRAVITLALGGFVFSLYLSYVQEFLLRTWCIMCIASFVIITLILIFSIASNHYCARCRKTAKDSGKNGMCGCCL